MKKVLIYPTAAGLALVLGLAVSPVTSGQPAPPPATEVGQIVRTLQEQTTKMKTNQATMEEKLAEIEENLRQTRIFVSRSGRGGSAQ